MEDLLLLVHRIPYPPNKGDKIRSYHLLRHLAARYRVHLGCFIDDADDWQHRQTLDALCASSHYARLNPLPARLRSLGSLLGGTSLSCGYYRDAGLRDWVRQTVEAHGVQRMLAFSSAMAQYVQAYPQARRVVDFVDVDSDKWRQYAARKQPPMRWLYAHEARSLLAFERQVAHDCDAALFVSAPEAELFRGMAPESAARIGHFSNGVDTAYFTPEQGGASPFAREEAAIVFTGAMDYWPNVDAVQWFASEVLPAVRARFPQAVFWIVGARPNGAVQQLASQPGVRVTGTVPDVRPYLAHAAVCVAPLRVARGIQNKVLEAMAMAKPVVVSPQALEGIAAAHGRELLLAQDAAAFEDTVVRLLQQPDAAIGHAARAAVEQRYSWDSNLAGVDRLLEARPPVRRQA
ncbi:TIGR03087 family PEP-CTERM/XrtA system glycosyltransferase [Duganella callida]|uniref:TIGR03087 family PEP-CTERM/XrtA system glycosyltransferase n=1 Tax=Duganella callida TaxID=2561932 RepID=A0A4Y9S7B6_9BURK|nr:TIGR03087 family PEP-CTERM/XrtA system glycosyltransferase [Duganella callida]TFW15418.1 TIGR03087 family PEP-CTERM/XrtA system glycosyltransferase [Duganella callida]